MSSPSCSLTGLLGIGSAQQQHFGILRCSYRLPPEAPFPASVDDALASALRALQHLDAFGAAGLALGGDSARANIATVTAAALARDGVPVKAQLLIYPGIDLSQVWPSHAQFGEGYFLNRIELDTFYCAYLPGGQGGATDPRVSPLRSDTPQGMAPALVVTAG